MRFALSILDCCCIRNSSDRALESLSHTTTEPAAGRVSKKHPDLAARIYRGMGMRILKKKKSKYYDAALSNFEAARRCFLRAGLAHDWDAMVAEVRQAHHRKLGFMADFERLVAGHGPSLQPSFLERARSRWTKRGEV